MSFPNLRDTFVDFGYMGATLLQLLIRDDCFILSQPFWVGVGLVVGGFGGGGGGVMYVMPWELWQGVQSIPMGQRKNNDSKSNRSACI